MKRLRQALALLFIFVVVPYGLLAFLWKDRCKETRLAELQFQSGALLAATISTDCGRTMKIATEVRLERRGEGEDRPFETVLLMTGRHQLPLVWSEETEGPRLSVTLPEGAEVVKHRTEWNGVTVAFRGGPADKAPPVAGSAGAAAP